MTVWIQSPRCIENQKDPASSLVRSGIQQQRMDYKALMTFKLVWLNMVLKWQRSKVTRRLIYINHYTLKERLNITDQRCEFYWSPMSKENSAILNICIPAGSNNHYHFLIEYMLYCFRIILTYSVWTRDKVNRKICHHKVYYKRLVLDHVKGALNIPWNGTICACKLPTGNILLQTSSSLHIIKSLLKWIMFTSLKLIIKLIIQAEAYILSEIFTFIFILSSPHL